MNKYIYIYIIRDVAIVVICFGGEWGGGVKGQLEKLASQLSENSYMATFEKEIKALNPNFLG